MALFLVIGEGAFVLSTISIDESSFAMHLIVPEFSSVATSVGPHILATAFHFVV